MSDWRGNGFGSSKNFGKSLLARPGIHVRSESPIGLLLYRAHHGRDSDPISKGRRREPVLPRPKMRSKEHKPVDADKL